MAEDIASGFVPFSSGAAAIARGTDPYIREAHGLRESIQRQIPGRAERLPAMLDQFGQPVPREGGIVDAMFNPAKRTTDLTFDPVLGEISRLDVNVSRRRPGGTRDRATTRELVEHEGPVLYDRLARLIQSPGYQQLNDVGRKAAFEALIVRTRGAASRAQNEARAQ
jgi:hypothetical protein